EKKDPTAKVSEVVKPIVFYVDHSVPEPVRSALVEGGNWWATAFEAAGYKNAYRVEVLPEDVHPLDARYSVVNWVHRETRGWSYGGSVVDPRTGEIIKGNVLLGSLRVRQDRMIFEGLVGADATGKGGANDPQDVALARIRQLAAHEIGHALGFAHNMAASTVFDRSSVMDYPAPRIGLTAEGDFDLSDAYGVGMGVWDDFSVAYLYGGADEAAIRAGYAKGLIYVTDPDSRTAGMAHPSGILWDNGTNGVTALAHTLKVRRTALDRFGMHNVAEGQNVSDLAKVIVPIYLLHRYETEGAAKQLAGMTYQYSRRGDGLDGTAIVPKAQQMAAVDVLLSA
ncbi:MAG: zinc-dependent metalloprotease, partial [Sphingomonadales bacterium]|nr:zinc-dependent metalloprotease [Sphingomonadales bacterium]